jgi:cysteine-rich repeat protein
MFQRGRGVRRLAKAERSAFARSGHVALRICLPWICLAAGISACGSKDRRPSDLNDSQLGGRSHLDAGSGGLWNPDEGTADAGVLDDAAAPLTDGGGTQPDPTGDSGAISNTCGDGWIDPGEECDPGLPISESCTQRGFDSGLLTCGTDCRFDTQSCTGTESCFDGRDNDGDLLFDCADPDCSSLCSDACEAPPVLSENSSVSGNTGGHGAVLAASCSDATPSGNEVVYQVTATQDGKLDVRLSSDRSLTLSVRSSCTDALSELACGGRTRLTLDAEAGETYFILVDGATGNDNGAYSLELGARQQACGDRIRDAAEECDDGNTDDGDGCDAACDLELSETENNNRRSRADTFNFLPWFAQISPVDDVDFYRVTLTAASSTLVVETVSLGDDACALNAQDTLVEIFDTNTNDNVLLASDDDGGDGQCSRAVATGLPAGTYFLRVLAGTAASPSTFPYRLEVSVGVCGNGDPTSGEGCDDGNRDPGDGCDADCRVEDGP